MYNEEPMLCVPPVLVQRRLTMVEVNYIHKAVFIAMFRNVVENSPDIVELVLKRRPFNSLDHMKMSFVDVIDWLHGWDKIKIIKRYGNLMRLFIKRFEPPSDAYLLYAASAVEGDIEENDPVVLYKILEQVIDQYVDKFGFPFLFWPEKQTVRSIIEECQVRLFHCERRELIIAIEIIYKIMHIRLDSRIVAFSVS